MPDYIYLLENRLTPEQQSALQKAVQAARDNGLTVFLSGGAVRDFTSGFPVRDLDISVQGNALTLRKPLEKAGAIVTGSDAASQTLYLRFPGVRMEVSATRTETFPKPGKPDYSPASMLEDLRRRDFTANAMALSLNDGSYGLLLDPLNGVADIESRLLRLTTNTGFIDEPSRLVRAARLMARYGWTMDERTETRYKTAKEENYIKYISAARKGYELEEIAHEEDPLRALRHLEEEGWMEALFPALKSGVADESRLEELRDTLNALQGQGINPDASAANFEIITAGLKEPELAALKKLLPNPGFVEEWESLEADAREFAKALGGKDGSTPSTTWKLMTSYKPEAVLWLAMTGKAPSVQTKFKNFLNVWPEARQRIPYALMQEMRITPDLPDYQDIQRKLFYMVMDDKLKTEEETRAFLEPFSPPAPPPPVNVRRPRPKKAAEKSRSKKAAVPVNVETIADAEEPSPDDPFTDDPATEEELDLVLGADIADEIEEDIEEAMEAKQVASPAAAPAGVVEKNSAKATPPTPPAKNASAKAPAKTAAEKKPASSKAEKPAAVEVEKPAPEKAEKTAAAKADKPAQEKADKPAAKKTKGASSETRDPKAAAKAEPKPADKPSVKAKEAKTAKAVPTRPEAKKQAAVKPAAKAAAQKAPAKKGTEKKAAEKAPAKKAAAKAAPPKKVPEKKAGAEKKTAARSPAKSKAATAARKQPEAAKKHASPKPAVKKSAPKKKH